MPAIEITDTYPPRIKLEAGDVVMVHRKMRDRETKKEFTWKFLGTVRKPSRHGAKIIIFGGVEGGDEFPLVFSDARNTAYFITPDSWPDGVHAFRTRLILEGRLDDAVAG